MTKVLLYFSENNYDIENFNEFDVIISQDPIASEGKFKLILLQQNLINIEDYLESYNSEINKSQFNSALTDIIKANSPNFFNHILRSVFQWVEAIDSLANGDEVFYFSRASKNLEYIPFYEAEGEINKKLFYKKHDFIPVLLKAYLTDKQRKSYTLKSEYFLKVYFRIFIRRYALLIFKFCFFVFQIFKYKKQNNKISNKVKFIFLSRSISQTHFFSELVLENECSLLYIADGVTTLGNQKNISKSFPKASYWLDDVSVLDVVVAFFKTFYYILSLPRININIKGLTFNFTSSMVEMCISNFDCLIYENALNKLLKKVNNKVILITAEMISPYPFSISKLARKFNFKSIQVQSTLFEFRPMPVFLHCDLFLFTSYQSFYENSRIHLNNAHKMAYWGILSKLNNLKISENLSKLIYFTQPYDKKTEFEIILKLISLSKVLKFSLEIKLHPRDNITQYKDLGDLYFIPQEAKEDDYISNMDLAIIRTSALSKSLIFKGVNVLICLHSEDDKNIKVEHINDQYFKYNIFSFDLNYLETIISDFGQYKLDYELYRNDLIKTNQFYFDLVNFKAQLDSYYNKSYE